MNIIAMRQETRKSIILDIVKSINKSLDKNTNRQFDYESIVIAIQSEYYCTRRTAREYADIALYKIGIDKNDLTSGVQTKLKGGSK